MALISYMLRRDENQGNLVHRMVMNNFVVFRIMFQGQKTGLLIFEILNKTILHRLQL